MEAISASDAAIANEPIHAITVPHTNDVGPPLRRPAWKLTATDSHDACKLAPNAIVGMKLMYLWIGQLATCSHVR